MKREQMVEQRRAAAAARQELKEDRKPKQTAAGPAPSMALRTQASLHRALSNDDDGMFWDYGQAAGLRAGVRSCPGITMPLMPLLSFFFLLLCFPVVLLCSVVYPFCGMLVLMKFVQLAGEATAALPSGEHQLCCREGTCPLPLPPSPLLPV